MIRLIRSRDGMEILLNADTISSYIEEGSGTQITLLDGETFSVKNQALDIREKIEAWCKGKADDEHPVNRPDLQEV